MKEDKLYNFLRTIYTIIIKIIFLPKIEGKENIPDNKPVIFAGNHFCALDPLLVMMSTKKKVVFLAKSSLFKGLHGKIFRKIGLIPVYRDRANGAAIVEAEQAIESGCSIGIFPEGKRNRKRREQILLPFRKGNVIIAKRTNTKIVPFAIKGKYIPWFGKLKICFKTPIDVDEKNIDAAVDEVKNEVLNVLRK